MSLEREVDGDSVRRRLAPSSSRSACVHKQHQNTSAATPPPARPQICTKPEKHRPSGDLSGGSKEGSPPASVSASKIFFSDQDKIPGLGGEPEEPTLEEHCTQAIINKAREIEKLYKQDCETLGMVVKMLISKDPTPEQKLLTALKKNLVDIRGEMLGKPQPIHLRGECIAQTRQT
ncbi:periphilin-1 [Ctenopharyngodon idella]|uniref:periphilin-1 n=1 Tax=Ctenopharyngodon idella TaxID=7959 RepID=UPI00222FA385|nr:periphilin-1 [Ctenopharyngodon idella]